MLYNTHEIILFFSRVVLQAGVPMAPSLGGTYNLPVLCKELYEPDRQKPNV